MNLKKDLENSFSSNITKNLLHKIYSVPIDKVGFINSIAESRSWTVLRAIVNKASAKHPAGASYRGALNSSAEGKPELQVEN